MITNANCTVYNKYKDPATKLDKYKPTHLYGVFWNSCKAFNTNKSGLQTADSLKVFIPFSIKNKNDFKPTKQYKGIGWTLQKGDILIKGILSGEINSISELEKLYDDVHLITTIDTKDFGSEHMRHWEVSGR